MLKELIEQNEHKDLEARRQEWYQPWEVIESAKRFLMKEGRPMIEEFGRAPLPTEFGDFTYIVFGDFTTGQHHELLVYGNLAEGSLGDGENVLVRMHSSCRTNEAYHAINCECRKELHQAMQLIQQEGRGVIVYLEQEGRGTGIAGKLAQLNGMFGWQDGRIEQKRDPKTGERIDTDRAYKEAGYPSECRDYTVAGQMLQHIGVKSVRLLTNNPQKIAGIESAGIAVTPIGIHITPDNEIIASDLASKAKNLGHAIDPEHYTLNGNGGE
jgi:GTP cyclohydrolase II